MQTTIDDFQEERRMLARFWEYHRANPEIYRQFDRFTREAIASGREHYGANGIVERIRWHTQVTARREFGDGFKVNNNYAPFYARLWLRDNPEHATFFRLRRQRFLSGLVDHLEPSRQGFDVLGEAD